MTTMKALTILAAATSVAQATVLKDLLASASASGKTSGSGSIRIQDWDCKAYPDSPFEKCDVDDNPTTYGGNDIPTFTCSGQHSYAKNTDLAYGFATMMTGTFDAQIVGACYKLTYDVAVNTTGDMEISSRSSDEAEETSMKTLVVQTTNVTRGVGEALFDIAIPGSGRGPFSQQACVEQFSAPSEGHGHAETESDCDKLPKVLQTACRFRFDFFEDLISKPKRDVAGLSSAVTGSTGLKVDFARVKCPSELVEKSKFVLPDDDEYPEPPSYSDGESYSAGESEESHESNEDDSPADDDESSYEASDDDESNEHGSNSYKDDSSDDHSSQDFFSRINSYSHHPSDDHSYSYTASQYEKRDGPPQQEYSQCGGQGYAGPTNCASGLSCKVQSPYYSQCLANVAKLYAQCGGNGFNGPSRCADGLNCNIVHAKYSQCQPPPSTPSANPPTPVEARASAQTLYGQCSGANWAGATHCADGLQCFTRDATYGQCLQKVQLLSEQCGGTLYLGPNLCVTGAKCKKLSPEYSQCLPDDGSYTEESAPAAYVAPTEQAAPSPTTYESTIEEAASTPTVYESPIEEPIPSPTPYESETEESIPSPSLYIQPTRGALDRDPKRIATAADGVGNEDKSHDEDKKDSRHGREGPPTVTDGVSFEGAAADLVAPSAILGLAVLAAVLLL